MEHAQDSALMLPRLGSMWPVDLRALVDSALRFRRFCNARLMPHQECDDWVRTFQDILDHIHSDPPLIALIHGLQLSDRFAEIMWLLTSVKASAAICNTWSPPRSTKLILASTYLAQNIQDMTNLIMVKATRTWSEFNDLIADNNEHTQTSS
jgi:hypothetical protein